jgi:hypothetical protein
METKHVIDGVELLQWDVAEWNERGHELDMSAEHRDVVEADMNDGQHPALLIALDDDGEPVTLATLFDSARPKVYERVVELDR